MYRSRRKKEKKKVSPMLPPCRNPFRLGKEAYPIKEQRAVLTIAKQTCVIKAVLVMYPMSPSFKAQNYRNSIYICRQSTLSQIK
jgi:hypothetical protein